MMKEEVYKDSVDVLDAEMAYAGKSMTINGAVNKTLILVGIMLITTVFSYAAQSRMLLLIGVFGGAGLYFFTSMKKEKSAILAPMYAVLQGLFVGSISAMFAYVLDGIIFQAVSLTISILFMMLFLYKTGIIKVTERFRSVLTTAIGAVMLLYIVEWVLSFFGINIPYLHEGGMIGIGISLVIIAIASLKFLLDFDSFEKGEQYKAPQYMEWYSAMGLLFTLVWLYSEILHLLFILQSGD